MLIEINTKIENFLGFEELTEGEFIRFEEIFGENNV